MVIIMKFIKNENKFNNLAIDFYNYLLIDKKYSEKTIESYMNDLYKFYIYISKNNLNIDNMKRGDIINYIKYLKNEHLQSSTINHNISVVKSFYKFLVITKNFKSNPSDLIDTPKKNKILPKVLSVSEVDKLLDIDLVNEYSYRNKAMLECMYATGTRVSELVSIKVNDIDFDSCLLKVMGKGAKERIIPLSDNAIFYIKKYLTEYRVKLLKNNNTEYLFLNNLGKKISRQSFFKMVKNEAIKKNIKTNFSPHTLRHSFATHLLDGGADIVSIKELLGHSSLATTQIYTHISDKKLSDDYKKFHPHG